ncbi:MAG: hypothetical protein IT380_08220 [Myxococcales bacterium]|nr:hypothetical protein [Myxococcales bacterium]
MEGFLHNILSFPTVPLTVALGVVVLYWLFALVTGAVFDAAGGAADAIAGGVKGAGDAAAGALKGAGAAAAGALKGAGDAVAGAVKGVGDAVAGAADAAGDAVADVHDAGFLALLGIGRIPITVTASATVLTAWTLSALGTALLHPDTTLVKVGLLLAALVAGFFATALLLRPFGKAMAQAKPTRRRDVLGQVCTITSGKVDAGFGTAVVDDGGAGINVMVVCGRTNALKKGDRALLVDFDRAKDTYEVEPVDWLLPEELKALEDPARAETVLSSRVRRR